MTARDSLAWEGNMKRLNRHRWTVFAVVVWVLALGLTTVLVPGQSEAKVPDGHAEWMLFAPNTPSLCFPMPYDCYVIWVYPS